MVAGAAAAAAVRVQRASRMGNALSCCGPPADEYLAVDVGGEVRTFTSKSAAASAAVFGTLVQPDGNLETAAYEAWRKEVQGGVGPEKDGSGPVGSVTSSQSAMSALLDPRNTPLVGPSSSHDMTLPLSKYWINSSHNTYLTGNQLTSDSSPKALVNALLLGCRVVELDCYDGSGGMNSFHEPIVYHGGTATKPCTFKSCLEAIVGSAFVATPYPVIVSLENHTSKEGQKQMAKIIHEVVGDALYVPPKKGMPKEFPSPEDLKGKVLFRDKPIIIKKEHAKTTDEPTGEPSSVKQTGHIDDEHDEHITEEAVMEDELLKLIAITNVSNKASNFDEAVKMTTKASSSYAEGKLAKLMGSNEPAAFYKYTQMHLARIFPAGLRVDSSNYDPSDGWSMGCQVVALNFQHASKPMWINISKFRANGGRGYILKPPYMLEDVPAPVSTARLEVTVLMGTGWDQFKNTDMFSAPDTYISITLTGASKDRAEHKTSVYNARKKTGEMAQPFWNETFTFDVSDLPQSVLLLSAMDHDVSDSDDHLGSYGFPLSELAEGWRMLPLHDGHGKPFAPVGKAKTPVGLLCKFRWL